jgi:polysaccharide deacetylase 2 family uncharacterized protein YibQ
MKKRLLISVLSVLLLLAFVAVILTSVDRKKIHRVRPAAKGKIAIVLDDWGYTLNNLDVAGRIKQRLTCAVLPNLKNSSYVARKLNELGFEIILHLPTEPKEKYPLEKETITVSMDSGRIREIINSDLSSVPGAKGISNHMGSRVTEDPRVSALIISEAKKRKLYFLDSFVTAKSACPLLASRLRTRFAKRDIFLDNQDDPDYIRKQVIKLSKLSEKKGYAIGIGHDRKNTLLVLSEIIPELEKSGYKFVFVSEVVK